MGRKRKPNTDPGPSSSKMKSASIEDTGENKSEPEVILGRTRSETQKLKDLTAAKDNGSATSKDWRQNAAVIEAICEHLPVKDLKATRLVCKEWAVAGSVPLSHKSVFNPRSSSHQMPLELWECYVKFDESKRKLWDTGFNLRHVKLDLTGVGEVMKHGSEMRKLIQQRWLKLVCSGIFQMVVSMKVYCCSSAIVDKYLLAQVLPRYCKNLKSLEFEQSVRGGPDVQWSLPEDAPVPCVPVLQSLRMDGTTETTWDVIKNYVNLQEVHLNLIFSPWRSDRQMDIEGFNKAFNGKALKSVILRSNTSPVEPEVWIPFCATLVTLNEGVLQFLRLTAWINTATEMTSFLDRLPVAQKLLNLQSCELAFHSWDRRFQGTAQDPLTPEVSQAFSQLHLKGYLQTKRLVFSFNNGEDSLLFRKNPSGSVIIEVELCKGHETLFPPSFQNILTDAYPEINYVCNPCRKEYGRDTTMFERLGRNGVFDPLRLSAEWKSLKPGVHRYQFRKHLCGFFEFSFFRSSDVIRRNALLHLRRTEWEDFLLSSQRWRNYTRVCIFDTIPDLSEAWARLQSSDSDDSLKGSTIKKKLTPSVVRDGQGAYAFARFFSNY